MKLIKVSWEVYEEMINKLVNQIKDKGMKFNGIYGVPRGGLPIATELSHKLNLPLLLYPTKDSLIVDDISDTGETLYFMKRKATATLFSTDWTITKPNFFVDKKLNKDEWLQFPWEENMEETNERQTTLDEFEKEE